MSPDGLRPSPPLLRFALHPSSDRQACFASTGDGDTSSWRGVGDLLRVLVKKNAFVVLSVVVLVRIVTANRLLPNSDHVEIEIQTMTLLLIFLGMLLVPCAIYGLSRWGVLSPASSDLMLGGFIVVAGVLFLSVGVFVFVQSGYLLHPSKHGPTSIPPDSGWFSKLGAIAMSLLLGGGAIWAGVDVIRKRNRSR